MARSYAPIYTSIWHDPEFVALSSRAQRAYFLALSQPDMNYCGVISYTTKRWAHMAADTKPRDIERPVGELEAAGFVMLDHETEELWVRSFVKHNGVLKQPQLRTAMRRGYADIHSAAIRVAFLASLPEMEREGLDVPQEQPDGRLPGPCGPTGGIGVEESVERPEPSTPDLDTEPEPASSRRVVPPPSADEHFADDETTDRSDVIEEGFRLLAQRRLDRRNTEARGAPVVGSVRRNLWIERDVGHSREMHTALAERYLANEPDLTPAELAERLDDPVADVLSHSPLGAA